MVSPSPSISAIGGRCQRCGYDEFLSALGFRKRLNERGTDMIISQLMRRYRNSTSEANWQMLLAEGRICGLFCANCLDALEAGEWKYRG